MQDIYMFIFICIYRMNLMFRIDIDNIENKGEGWIYLGNIESI